MASATTNFGLTKSAYTDTADVAVINDNMDKVDTSLNGLADAVAIVANNNTHAAITTGQYVYVHGHGSLAEGLYTAKSNIAANATLSTSNLQADGSGGLNAMNDAKVSKSGDTMSGALTIYDNIMANQGKFAGTATGSTADQDLFVFSAIEVREAGRVGDSQTSRKYAPRIGFHWSDTCAASLAFDSDIKFHFLEQDGVTPATIVAEVEGESHSADISDVSWTTHVSTLIKKVIRSGNYVTVNLRMVFTDGYKLGTDTNFANIPSGYRPSGNIAVPAFIQVNNADAWVPYVVTIKSDGYIKQDLTANRTGIAIMGIGFYI